MCLGAVFAITLFEQLSAEKFNIEEGVVVQKLGQNKLQFRSIFIEKLIWTLPGEALFVRLQ